MTLHWKMTAWLGAALVAVSMLTLTLPDAQAQIAERSEAAHRGIPVTLAAIRKAAEST